MQPTELDPLIHVPARLRIVATLAALEDGASLTFPRLQEMTELSAGNLLTHLRKLEEAQYVAMQKSGGGAGSVTEVTLSDVGRRAFASYRAVLRALLA